MEKKTKYAPNELLEIEVTTSCLNLVVGSHYLGNNWKEGKTRLEVLASELPLFENLIEPNQDVLADCQNLFDLKIKGAMESTKDENLAKVRALDFKYSNSPQRMFRERMMRDPKPIMKVDVVESKGLVMSEQEKSIKLATEKASEAQAATIAAVLKALEESKSSNKK